MLVTSADIHMGSSSEADETSAEELDVEPSEIDHESKEPSIEVVNADDDLSAVVNEAMDESTIETDDVEEADDLEYTSSDDSASFLVNWWKADDSHLAATLPEFSFLSKAETIRGVMIISLSTLLLQLWNMLFGLASSAAGKRENTINWWDYFFVSGADSSLAPEFSDPLGWVLLIVSFCILISTMPRHPKN